MRKQNLGAIVLLCITVAATFFTGCNPPTTPVEESSIATYSIQYMGNGNTGGTAPTDSGKYKAGDKVTVMGQSSLTCDGKKFMGWAETNDAVTAPYATGASYTMPAKDATLFAIWAKVEPTTFTVTFETCGGSAVAKQIVTSGKTVDAPARPEKEGYTFAGWYRDSAYTMQWDFANTSVIGDITLYAKWNAIQPGETLYSIIYDGNGNDSGEAPVDNGKCKTGDKITVMGPGTLTLKGKIFQGWAETKDAKTASYPAGSIYTISTKNVTLFAVWVAPDEAKFTVSFNSMGGSAIAPQYVANNGKATKPSDPEPRDHFTFKGWCKNIECSIAWNFDKDLVTKDLCLYARWIEDPKLTYYNGSTKLKEMYYKPGDQITVDDLESPASGKFMGWTSRADEKIEVKYRPNTQLDTTGKSFGTDLYAVIWPYCHITYRSDSPLTSGSLPVDSGKYLNGDKVNAQCPAIGANGKHFLYWADLNSGLSYKTAADQIPIHDSDVELLAIWADYKTVSFETEGLKSAYSQQTHYVGETFTLFTITLADQTDRYKKVTFLGWSKGKNSVKIDYANGATITMGKDDMTLYPRWRFPDDWNSNLPNP